MPEDAAVGGASSAAVRELIGRHRRRRDGRRHRAWLASVWSSLAPCQSRLVLAIVAVVGAASLGAEIAAARLLAPYFGASTIVWANTIATVLVALSRRLLARRAARRPRPDGPRHGRIVLVAAALLAVVPFVAGPFLGVPWTR